MHSFDVGFPSGIDVIVWIVMDRSSCSSTAGSKKVVTAATGRGRHSTLIIRDSRKYSKALLQVFAHIHD